MTTHQLVEHLHERFDQLEKPQQKVDLEKLLEELEYLNGVFLTEAEFCDRANKDWRRGKTAGAEEVINYIREFIDHE